MSHSKQPSNSLLRDLIALIKAMTADLKEINQKQAIKKQPDNQ